jgi:hypothetical protein
VLDALGLDPTALPGWWQGWPPRLHVQHWRDELGLSEAEIVAAAEAPARTIPNRPMGQKRWTAPCSVQQGARSRMQARNDARRKVPRQQRRRTTIWRLSTPTS